MWTSMAAVLAEIHGASDVAQAVPLPRVGYALPFEAPLRAGLGRLDDLAPCELREVMRPRRHEVLAQLDRLAWFGAAARRQPAPEVLCHTDFGGDNLLVHGSGLSVLDWDTATVGPVELDLRLAAETDAAHFLGAYRAAGGDVTSVTIERLAFYLLRRYVEDMTARFLRMLDEDPRPDEAADAIAGMHTWGFEQWARLDDVLERLAAALR